VHQVGRCRIFVGISGHDKLRQLAMDSLRLAAAMPEKGIDMQPLGRHHQWVIVGEEAGDEYVAKSQFQHYKALLGVSMLIKSNAWLMFLDNDDLYHPLWVRFFQDKIAERKKEKDIVEGRAFYCGSKLLIDVAKVNDRFGDGEEGIIKYDQFIPRYDELADLVTVAATIDENAEMNTQEYFDFCVRSDVLQSFIEATPDGILCSKFCDCRFAASVAFQDMYEHPTQKWLLMHHRVRCDDIIQQIRDSDLDTYTNSMLKVEISDDDCHLAQVTGLRDVDIAFHRRDIEECAIQAVGRDDEYALFHRNRAVRKKDKRFGHRIGTLLWDQVMENFESYYMEEQAIKSKNWWIDRKVPPPPEHLIEDADYYW